MSLLGDLLDVRKAQARATRQELSESAALAAASSRGGGGGPTSRRCLFCHKQIAPYTCPSCNAPYCSLACFRSPKHEACSVPFSDQALRVELGAKSEDGARATDEERKAMMELLRKLRHGGIEDMDEDEGSGDGDAEGSEAGQEVHLDGIDLENATDEMLLSLLSKEERERFEAAARDEDPDQSRLRALAQAIEEDERRRAKQAEQAADEEEDAEAEQDGGKVESGRHNLLSQLEGSLPWWVGGGGTGGKGPSRAAVPPAALKAFVSPLEKLLQARHAPTSSAASKGAARGPELAYNIIAVLLVYAYILQHLDVPSLSSLRVPIEGVREEGRKVEVKEAPVPPSPVRTVRATASASSRVADAETGGEDEYADMPPLEDDDGVDEDLEENGRRDVAPEKSSSATLAPSELTSPLAAESVVEASKDDKPSREEAERRYLCTTALEELQKLLPFLFALPPAPSERSKAGTPRPKDKASRALRGADDASRLVLTSVESAGHFLLSLLGPGAGPQPVRSLHHLLGDVLHLLEPRLVLLSPGGGDGGKGDDGTSRPFEALGGYKDAAQRREKVLLVLADLHHFLSHVHVSDTEGRADATPATPQRGPPRSAAPERLEAAARKLLFYGSYLLRVSAAEERDVVQEVGKERERLEEEMERGEEEERIQAARRFEEGVALEAKGKGGKGGRGGKGTLGLIREM